MPRGSFDGCPISTKISYATGDRWLLSADLARAPDHAGDRPVATRSTCRPRNVNLERNTRKDLAIGWGERRSVGVLTTARFSSFSMEVPQEERPLLSYFSDEP